MYLSASLPSLRTVGVNGDALQSSPPRRKAPAGGAPLGGMRRRPVWDLPPERDGARPRPLGGYKKGSSGLSARLGNSSNSPVRTGANSTEWQQLLAVDTIEAYGNDEAGRERSRKMIELSTRELRKQIAHQRADRERVQEEDREWGMVIKLNVERQNLEERQKQERAAEALQRFKEDRDSHVEDIRRRRREDKDEDDKLDKEVNGYLAEKKRQEMEAQRAAKLRVQETYKDIADSSRSAKVVKQRLLQAQAQEDKALMQTQQDGQDHQERERREFFEKLRGKEPRTSPELGARLKREAEQRAQEEQDRLRRAERERDAKEDAKQFAKEKEMEMNNAMLRVTMKNQREEQAARLRLEREEDAKMAAHFKAEAETYEAEERKKLAEWKERAKNMSDFNRAMMEVPSPLVTGLHGAARMNTTERSMNYKRLDQAMTLTGGKL